MQAAGSGDSGSDVGGSRVEPPPVTSLSTTTTGHLQRLAYPAQKIPLLYGGYVVEGE